ncbi:MAG: hypothetical protein ABIQ70_01805 [Dokdonella sp.]
MMGLLFSPDEFLEYGALSQAAALGASGTPSAIDTGVSTFPVVSVIEHFRDDDDDHCEVRVDWQETPYEAEPAAILRIASSGNGLVARQGARGAELHICGEDEILAVRTALRRILDELDDLDGAFVPANDAPAQDGPVSQSITPTEFDYCRVEPKTNVTNEGLPRPVNPCFYGNPECGVTTGSIVLPKSEGARYGSPSFPAAAF